MSITIVKPGIHSLLTDLGRFDYGHLGLTTGGPADENAFYWANRLLNNDENATCIEVTLGGLSLTTNTETIICITGASTKVQINNKQVPMWAGIKVSVGDNISIGYSQTGMRIYVAVVGGFDVAPSFGSTTTVVREGIGGLHGKSLQAGACLPVTPLNNAAYGQRAQALGFKQIPSYQQSLTLRYIPAYQYDYFSAHAIDVFEQNEYLVSQQSDRMGYSLQGAAVNCQQQTLASEAIAFGAIQVPANGQPIVLLNDRQTLGGYPKIGTVLSIDAHRLSQCQAGAKIRFKPISLNDATAAIRQFKQARQAIESKRFI